MPPGLNISTITGCRLRWFGTFLPFSKLSPKLLTPFCIYSKFWLHDYASLGVLYLVRAHALNSYLVVAFTPSSGFTQNCAHTPTRHAQESTHMPLTSEVVCDVCILSVDYGAVHARVSKGKLAVQSAAWLPPLTLAGLEPAIFGSEDQRLIH